MEISLPQELGRRHRADENASCRPCQVQAPSGLPPMIIWTEKDP